VTAAHLRGIHVDVDAQEKGASNSLRAVGKAASFAAVGIAAGVVMSTLAIDLTDAAIAGAIVAAGMLLTCSPQCATERTCLDTLDHIIVEQLALA
jgi:hypothetical protein